ncbi:MAG: hypothetical protein V1928_05720 [Parcubacteria group bacterium]
MFKEMFGAFKKPEKPSMPDAEAALGAERNLIDQMLKMPNIDRRVFLGFIKDSTDFLKQQI